MKDLQSLQSGYSAPAAASVPDAAAALPAVSVLIDVSDGEHFLDAALASLAAQTRQDFEIILCAHGATEATARLIRQWQAREPRLRLIWSERLPLARAHNLAASLARAPLLARLDADDVAMPDRLERQCRMFASDPRLTLAGSAVELIDRRGRVIGLSENPVSAEDIHARMPFCCPIVHSTVMIRADAFRAAGGYRSGLHLSEDYDLYARLLDASGRAGNCPTPLVRYRVHADSITSRKARRLALASLCVGAATLARRRGDPEPFIGGVPSLRLAAEILQLPRAQLRLRLRATASQAAASRFLLLHPYLHGHLRSLALRLGLRPAYSLMFRLGALVVALARSRHRRRPARPVRDA